MYNERHLPSISMNFKGMWVCCIKQKLALVEGGRLWVMLEGANYSNQLNWSIRILKSVVN